MTILEAMKALKISRKTYYRWVAAGLLHPRKIGPRRVVVPQADVDALLKGTQP